MADYTQYGYDEFLAQPNETNNSGSTGLAFDNENLGISGDLIQGGVITSADKKSTFDLQNGFINISDGVTDVLQLGKLPDNSYGLVIKDRAGNILFQFTGDTNIIQSSNGHFQADFNEERILVKDDGGTPVALFGKQVNGF